MRVCTLLIGSALCAGLAMAEAHLATYVDGNLEGFNAHSGATVDLAGLKAIEVQSGESKVEVPFAGISRAEAGEVIEHSTDEPLYKVWTLPGRFFNKRETQHVKLDYKSDKGESRTLTLEMEREAVESLLARIEERTAGKAPAKAPSAWWGDAMWKTNRNKTDWGGAGEVAGRE